MNIAFHAQTTAVRLVTFPADPPPAERRDIQPYGRYSAISLNICQYGFGRADQQVVRLLLRRIAACLNHEVTESSPPKDSDPTIDCVAFSDSAQIDAHAFSLQKPSVIHV
jgi:hypothetical protein